MPSTENTTLDLIQQEIQDLMARERELKSHYSAHNGNNNVDHRNGDNNHADDASSSLDDGSSIDERIEEVDKASLKIAADGDDEDDVRMANGNASAHERPPLLRAKSTSVLENNNNNAKPSFRRFVSANPSTKGVMQRFLKSRGKLQAVAALHTQKPNGYHAPAAPAVTASNAFKSAFTNGNLESYEMAPPKIEPGQCLRKGFVSAEEKIQRDIADTYKREAELKTLRQSQGNLAYMDDAVLDAPLPNYMGGLRASKSLAQLYNSNEHLEEPNCGVAASAPCSLKPARSLAELCDAKDEEVTSSQTLIMRFEQMIIKNQESKRT